MVACGDGETHCSKVRSDEVQDGPSCGAKPATGPCGFTSLEQERPSAFDLPFFLVYRRPRAQGLIRLIPEPSSDRTLRSHQSLEQAPHPSLRTRGFTRSSHAESST